ncbi:N-acetyl-alpha-D-glucosaminyl-diphospho-ditrans, octacis-undecaprenol 4-epimerase [Pseudomonas fluorescens]|uniref:N-acetyl-alpha-D-glucosaminyl-diphospho-ditrans, octacis-undecaprenol 4-epimerase n=1 Tax=Pseudomonas fluorescens TaxID=294 RepID=A0A5E6UST6_PSEFL|nr:SDR family oxidoreductase [Pseudomonas fluorescens]VVN06104.1 N-acetyl-alpha-D-glucosaminyl-diphospho-ditrans, octacis-undecaprenol 4-epimerase [Pseudomonas fluorescens]
MSRILLTGVSGFVGGAIHDRLLKDNVGPLTAALRQPLPALATSTMQTLVSALDGDTDWTEALAGVGVVVHSAARVHVMNDTSEDPLTEFRRINVAGTLNLATQAAKAGVRRFVYVSSIKVNGEGTVLGSPFFADAVPGPVDPYGVSKMEAEQALRLLADRTGMEVVIVRPPLVYGPGVKANFLNMMRWLKKGIPLPFGSIHNRRSLVALDNLVDLIVVCIDHPAAANQTFLVSDGEDLSTSELLRRMGKALGAPARLLPVPSWMLETGAAVLGKKDLSQRLCGSLQVDITKNRELLGWEPPNNVDQSLMVTARHFLKSSA